jgi:hypothetical protein
VDSVADGAESVLSQPPVRTKKARGAALFLLYFVFDRFMAPPEIIKEIGYLAENVC